VALAATRVQLPFAPAVDRVFGAAEPMQLYFDVLTTSPSLPTIARVEVVSTSGDVLRSSAPVLPTNGHVNMPVATAGLAPGAYILRAVVTQGADTQRLRAGDTRQMTGVSISVQDISAMVGSSCSDPPDGVHRFGGFATSR